MLPRLPRLPLRRCLHTPPPRPRIYTFNRLSLILGASAAGAAILTWRLTSDNHRIALDASPPTTTHKTESRADDESTSAPKQDTEPEPESEKKAGSESESESEAETDGGGAFNPVTGEINWDCPCLGGMAHGPCGPQFKEAFSCFVYSEDEPKGINCVEKFKAMQDCFREHPDVYGEEIMDDEEEGGEAAALDGPDGSVGGGDAGEIANPAPEPTTASTPPKTTTAATTSSGSFEHAGPTPSAPSTA